MLILVVRKKTHQALKGSYQSYCTMHTCGRHTRFLPIPTGTSTYIPVIKDGPFVHHVLATFFAYPSSNVSSDARFIVSFSTNAPPLVTYAESCITYLPNPVLPR